MLSIIIIEFIKTRLSQTTLPHQQETLIQLLLWTREQIDLIDLELECKKDDRRAP